MTNAGNCRGRGGGGGGGGFRYTTTVVCVMLRKKESRLRREFNLLVLTTCTKSCASNQIARSRDALFLPLLISVMDECQFSLTAAES